ncbi:MAG TPA: hypothetical protein VGE04_13400 [Chloroflexia bacterium]
MKKRLSLLLAAALLPALAACGGSGLPTAPTLTPTTAPAQPTATIARPAPRRTPTTEEPPTSTSTLAPETPTSGSVDTPTIPADEGAVLTDPLAIELQATVVAGLPATPTPGAEGSDFGGFEGVNVIPLNTPDGSLWAAYSYGARRFEPLEQHFVAVYTHGEAGWRELGRVVLEDPDYVDRAGVEQVAIEPENAWLQVESGVGAHGGCFNLLRFDGQALHSEVSHCGAAPGAGTVGDLNGDGTLDVLLDATDHYVFCYACNVDYINTEVKRWDGSKMVSVELAPLPDTEPEELRRLTDEAIDLATHDLWKDAQATMSETLRFNSQDPTYTWDAALINLDASNRADHIQYSGFPIVSTIFYGDYPAALDILRGYNIEEMFNPDSSLFTNTPAEGYIDLMTQYVTRTTTLQLEAKPDLAGAYFVRGWSLALLDPADPHALADVQRAAELDPSERLFAEGLAYLKEQR